MTIASLPYCSFMIKFLQKNVCQLIQLNSITEVKKMKKLMYVIGAALIILGILVLINAVMM